MEIFLFLPTGIIVYKLEDSSGKKGINAPSAVIEKKHSSGNDKKGFVFVVMCTCGNFFVFANWYNCLLTRGLFR